MPTSQNTMFKIGWFFKQAKTCYFHWLSRRFRQVPRKSPRGFRYWFYYFYKFWVNSWLDQRIASWFVLAWVATGIFSSCIWDCNRGKTSWLLVCFVIRGSYEF
jgi:hypothetical protein